MNRTATYQEQDLFSEMQAVAQVIADVEKKQSEPILELPKKTTCSPSEAHRCTGFSVRQIRYWVEDGTLLAVDSSRNPISKDRPRGKLRRWRVVVHRVDGSPVPEQNEFLTLAELLPRITNKEIS